MLTVKHYSYDNATPADVQIARLNAAFEASPNADVLTDPRWNLANWVHRQARIFGISPLVAIIGLQREQSLEFVKAIGVQSWCFAEGVVGQDGPGTINHSWDGLLTQILMCMRSHAWSMGLCPWTAFGPASMLPSWSRFTTSAKVAMYDDTAHLAKDARGNQVYHLCTDRAEYAQLIYTPHESVLATNAAIAARLAQWWPLPE